MLATTSLFESPELVSRCALFGGLAPDQLRRVARLMSERTVPPGAVIVRRGDPADELLIVHRGAAEVVGPSAGGCEQRIATLRDGAVIDDVTLLDQAPRSATVRALSPAVLGVMPIARLHALTRSDPTIERVLLRNLANLLSRRMRDTDADAATAREQHLEFEHARAIMAPFIVFMCFVMVSYTVTLQLAVKLLPPQLSSSLLTFPLTVLWFGAAWLLFRRSGLPMASFGVTTHGWRRALPQALRWTLAGCAGAAFLKLVLIWTDPAFAHERLFHVAGLFDPRTTTAELQLAVMLAVVYAFTAPLQEFIVRAGLQTALQRCFAGPSSRLQSIVLSNALFATAHVHLSLSFALVAFFAGLLFGGLFARQRQLVGVSVCHLLVGWFAFLVVGFEPWY